VTRTSDLQLSLVNRANGHISATADDVASCQYDTDDQAYATAILQVLQQAWKAGIAVAGYVGGGYHHKLHSLALWHSCLHRAAAECWHAL
jgi:hypothetical protein